MARCLLRYGRVLELSKRTGLRIEAITVRGGGRNTQTLHLHGGKTAWRDPHTGALDLNDPGEGWVPDYQRERYRKELQRRKSERCQWIRVTDGLPEPGAFVLAYGEHCRSTTLRNDPRMMVMYFSEGWWDANGDFEMFHLEVTHWRPMPVAPGGRIQ